MNSARASKYSEKGKVQASMLMAELKKTNRLPKYDLPKTILLYFGLQSSPKWHRKLEVKSFFGARLELAPATDIGVLSNFGIGAPAMAFYIELLVAFGAKVIMALGQAGALSAEQKIGDLILVTKALRDEGTSSHYVPPAEFSFGTERCAGYLRRMLSKSKIIYKEAPVWSTDALFRETEKEIRQYAQAGLAAVDMETSALYAIGHCLKVETASLLVISDELWPDQWRSDFSAARKQMQLVAEAIIASRCEL